MAGFEFISRSRPPESVVTSMAGFEPPESVVTKVAAFEPPESVVTSMAGFAGGLCPQPPGVRSAMPADLK
jgi:hypothetical protein